MQVIKQNLGIEVDSKKLKVSFQVLLDDLSIKVKGSRSFDNTAPGFKSLEEWLAKKQVDELPVHLIMEATGVYYEHLAYYFHLRWWRFPNRRTTYLASFQTGETPPETRNINFRTSKNKVRYPFRPNFF